MSGPARVAVVAALACGAALAGCGSAHQPDDRVPGHELTIYSSGPLHGASAARAMSVLAGERLALAGQGYRIGRYEIRLRVLDDSDPQRGGWDPGQTAANARLASTDRTAVGYLGELDSGASAIAIPVLNKVGIPEIGPAASAIGLTTGGPAASPGEPEKYYPTGVRTYARVMPSDMVQAGVQARIQQQAGCVRTAVVEDGGVDGEEMAESFQLAARQARLAVTPLEQFEPGLADYRAFAQGVAATGADCVLVSAITDRSAVPVTRALAQAMPRARIFGTGPLAESAFASAADGGLPGSLDGRVLLTAPAPGDGGAARRFYRSYALHYGAPGPDAIYGYEAMSLLLSAIARASENRHWPIERSRVRAAIFATHERRSVIGTYSIEPDGDTTMRRYGVYRMVDGQLRLWKVLQG